MVKLSDIELPVIFKNKLLFSAGIRNGWNILESEMQKSFNLTDWQDQKNRALYFAHSNRDAQKWVGRIENPYVVGGDLYGDLEVYDADLALKLDHGKAPIGVSAEIKWPAQYNDPTDFTYRGYAMVLNPEVQEAMVNFSSNEKEDGYKVAKLYTSTIEANFSNEEKEEVEEVLSEEDVKEDKKEDFAKVTNMEEKRKQMKMSLSKFYAAPRDPPSSSALPIFDAEHVRNALARFNQVDFLNDAEKAKAKRKIKAAAKKFKIEVSADFSDNIITSETAKGSPIGDELDLMSAERGLSEDKMEEDAKKANLEVEEKVEATEEVVEAPKEEAVEEKTETEEPKEADFSAFNDKLEALSQRISILEEKQAKFSEEAEKPEAEAEAEVEEEAVEEKEEEKEEEVKADFSEVLAQKIDKLADAIGKKEAAPMSTAEFGATKVSENDATIDRLTEFFDK